MIAGVLACLSIYAISIPFESINHLQLRAFYAMKDTLFPAIFGILGGIGAIAVSSAYAVQLGIYSIAIGYTVGEIIKTAGLWATLSWKTRRYLLDQ